MLASCGANLQLHSILSYEKTYEYGTYVCDEYGTSVCDRNTAYSNVSWSVDGKALVTTTKKGKVDVLHLSNSGLKLVHNVSVPNSTTACFMKSSPRCIAVGTNTGEVVIWDCKKKCEKNKFKELSSYVLALDFNTTDSYGAVLNNHGSISVFNCIQDCVVQTHQPPETQLCCVRFHAKKRMLLGGTTLEGGVYFWDILSNKEVYSSPNSHSAPCVDLSFSHVNEVLAVTAGYDKVINLFDFSITKPAISTVVEFPCFSVNISNDGQKVAVGCSQSSIFIYDFRAFKNPIKRIDNVGRVNRVVYQPMQKLEDTSSSWLKCCEEKLLYQRTDKSSPVLRGSIVVRKKSRNSNFASHSPSSSHEKSGNSTGGSSFLINHSDVSLNISKINLDDELFVNIGEKSIANHSDQKKETSPIISKASEGDGSFIDCPIVSKENLINLSSVNLNTEKNNHSVDSAQESAFNSHHSEELKLPKTVSFKNLNKIDNFRERVIAKVSCKGPSRQLNDYTVLSISSIDRKLSYSKTKTGHSLSKFTFSNSPNIQSMEPILSSPQSNTPKNIASQKEVLKVTTSTPNENDSSIDSVDTPPHQEFQEAYSEFVGQVKTLETQAEANVVGQVRSVGTQVEANLLGNKLDVSELNAVLDMNRYDSHAMNVRLAILTEERLVNAIVPQIEALRLEMQQLRKTVHSLHRSKNSTKICYSKRYQ